MGLKKKELQNARFQTMVNNISNDGIEYKNFVINIYKNYKEELKNRSIFTKIVVLIFGEINVLGESLVKDYGKENLDKLI